MVTVSFTCNTRDFQLIALHGFSVLEIFPKGYLFFIGATIHFVYDQIIFFLERTKTTCAICRTRGGGDALPGWSTKAWLMKFVDLLELVQGERTSLNGLESHGVMSVPLFVEITGNCNFTCSGTDKSRRGFWVRSERV